MRKLDPTKLANLKTVDGLFDEKYGAEGTETRAEFDAESAAWYFGELMRERRKRLNMTQEDLAQKINAKRTYISRVERGETDIQLSSFLRIAKALGIHMHFDFA